MPKAARILLILIAVHTHATVEAMKAIAIQVQAGSDSLGTVEKVVEKHL